MNLSDMHFNIIVVEGVKIKENERGRDDRTKAAWEYNTRPGD